MIAATNHRVRSLAVLATVALALTACGSEDEPNAASDPTPTASESPSTPESSAPATPSAPASSSAPAEEAPVLKDGEAFGAKCSAYTKPGLAKTSIKDFLDQPALAEFGKLMAKSTTGVRTGVTYFVPTKQAMAKYPPELKNAFVGDPGVMDTFVDHHLVPGRLAASKLVGMHESGDLEPLEVVYADGAFRVADEKAAILCGNLQLSNATVNIIDTPLRRDN